MSTVTVHHPMFTRHALLFHANPLSARPNSPHHHRRQDGKSYGNDGKTIC